MFAGAEAGGALAPLRAAPDSPPAPTLTSCSTRPPAESSSRGLVEALRTAYVNERCAPSLLPHQDEMINEIKELINDQARPAQFPPCTAVAVHRRPCTRHGNRRP